jgi:putative transposase
MARKPRNEFAPGLWHVTSRGVDKQTIFFNDADRFRFLSRLAATIDLFSWRLYAFVLMTNHYHLLLETSAPNLGRGMGRVNGSYAQGTNRRLGRSGHLFQGRFKGIPVQRESHLLELSRYIVLNPVRAGIVDSPDEWAWSSYAATSGLVTCPEWLEVDWLLTQFDGTSTREGARLYREFVRSADATLYRPWSMMTAGVLGDESFASRFSLSTESEAGAESA